VTHPSFSVSVNGEKEGGREKYWCYYEVNLSTFIGEDEFQGVALSRVDNACIFF